MYLKNIYALVFLEDHHSSYSLSSAHMPVAGTDFKSGQVSSSLRLVLLLFCIIIWWAIAIIDRQSPTPCIDNLSLKMTFLVISQRFTPILTLKCNIIYFA